MNDLIFAEVKREEKIKKMEEEMEAMNKKIEKNMEQMMAETDMVKRAIKELNREILEGMSGMKEKIENESKGEIERVEGKIEEKIALSR